MTEYPLILLDLQTALNMAVKCMSLDLKADNIVSVAVRPGIIETDMTKTAGIKGTQQLLSHPEFKA
jgi:NAD(P)-dependent dehydrogenase (short-subunit alcohol dehydrogenase family)